jgi:hypothetical protein
VLERHEEAKKYAKEHGSTWTIRGPPIPEIPEVLREKAALEAALERFVQD